jgi:hypothetical protein
MTTRNKQQMGGDLTAKHLGASVKLLYAAAETDFYLRQNELVTIVIPEVENK